MNWTSELFCNCRRIMTRALHYAKNLGDFCQVCEKRLGPSTEEDIGEIFLDTKVHGTERDSSEGDYVHTDNREQKFGQVGGDSDRILIQDNNMDDDRLEQLRPAMQQEMAAVLHELAGALGETSKFKLPPFRGEKNQNIESYIDKYNQFCENNGKNDFYKIENFKMNLDGRAYLLYDSMTEDVKNNWGLLTEKLKQYFAPVQLPPVQAYEHLHALKMKSSETVQSFFERIIEATKNLDVPESQNMAVFIANMPKHIKEWLIIQDPQTLGDALTMAKQRELIGAPEEDKDMKKLLTEILGKLKVKEDGKKADLAAMEKTQGKQRQIDELCGYCGKPGHTMSNCYQFLNSQSHLSSELAQQEAGIQCQMCGIQGHAMIDCESQNVRGVPPSVTTNHIETDLDNA